MEILNLDELAPIKRAIKLDGKDYELREMTVADFIEATAEAKRLEAQTEQDAVQNIESNIAHLQRVIPTLPEGRIRTLQFPQLMALIRFVNGEVTRAGEEGNAETAE